ncbi:DUF5916 domain-containing protein [Pseudofulvibacter geojedonensis]|uniref:DUF5916 domain-containing protein n=1 Tax=Pseudofulvibacter geojedonensis TaxID=1123758 RepID=A0ABW3I2A5_9FLAO
MKYTYLLLLLATLTYSQELKIYETQRIDSSLKIDATIEDEWKNKKVSFIQTAPNNGELSENETAVGILYDNEYLYVSAKLYVKNGDDINKIITFRDDLGNSDYFGITLDPFGKASEGYSFIVTPAGVQYDSKYGTGGSEFPEWNGVWESKVKVLENYWVVELKIPFNFLRFDKNNLLDFKFNMVRFTSKTNEQSWWNHINPEKNGFLNQFGKLSGIENISPPMNLSFYPFTSILYKDNKITNTDDFDFLAGLDVKYVYKNSYTLDVSIIPDFSQTTFDNEVLNLSAFEVKFDENRQFFTEGTDLFNKSDFFYTRRIGGTPYLSPPNRLDDNLKENPNSTQILNLIKVTGRTKKGFGIGVLNGLVNTEYAKYESGAKELINPLSNYNSVVLDQTLKNNSFLYFANSSVIRNGSYTDFNLTEVKFQGYDKAQNYSLSLSSSLSQHYADKVQLGHFYKAAIEKVGGNFRGGMVHEFYDDKFNPNDFGFLSRNNLSSFLGYLSYTKYKPFWLLNGMSLSFSANQNYYQSLWKREMTKFQINSRLTFKNNDILSLGSYLTSKGRDFFEPRVENRFALISPYIRPYLEYVSDINDRFNYQVYFFYKKYFDNPFNYEIESGYNLNKSIGDNLRFTFGQDFSYLPSNFGVLYVDGSQLDADNNIYYSERNVYNLTTSLKGSYLLSNKMGLSLNLRHLWAQVEDLNPYYIDGSGKLHESDLSIDFTSSQLNYNLFNFDLLYKWQFAPGSELSINWQKVLNVSNEKLENNLFNNLSNTFKSRGVNTFSFKLVYYLDFNVIKRHVL